MATFLEEYDLLDELGQGGFATVYKVRHKHLGYIRAIRVLNQTIARGEDDPVYKKFLDECRILLRLGNGNHPNIVHIYQPLLRAGHALVEMDYVDGSDLLQYVKQCNGFVPTSEVLTLLRQIGSALAYCHEDVYEYCMDREFDHLSSDPEDGSRVLIDDAKQRELIEKYRIIHNDIHSGNIIRRRNGNYILLDFGLAIEGTSVVCSSKKKGGAMEFKSPEKWDNENELSTQSDIYSFGIVLYHMLAGRVPFPYDKTQFNSTQAEWSLMNAHQNETPPAILPLRRAAFEATHPGETYVRDYPEWLEQVIMRCLEKKPQGRFANGKQLYEEVLRLENNPVESLGISDGVQVAKPATNLSTIDVEEKVNQLVEQKLREERECQKHNTVSASNEKSSIPPPSPPQLSDTTSLSKSHGAAKSCFPLILLFSIILIVGGVFFFKGCFEDSNGTGTTDVVVLPDTPSSVSSRTFTVGGVEFQMNLVEAGSFDMGSNSGYDNEKPVHKVTISQDYYIGQTEVTQALWEAVMGSNPSHFKKGGNHPVENVSWDDCDDFIKKLNSITGQEFRLPTEAEWEFAARGGSKSSGYEYAGSNTLSDVAWYGEDWEDGHHPVAQKRPNELGLYDMSGNVWEWCADYYGNYPSGSVTDPTGPSNGDYRVGRGGSCLSNAVLCRVAIRYFNDPGDSYYDLGLRLAL